VRRIGWNERFILVDRKASFGGDKDGWMIVDSRKEAVVGPFTDDELTQHSEVTKIVAHPPGEAWSLLR
jgi:hypothetical protein